MLVRESQRLDLKEVRLSQQTIDVNAQGMSRQFTIQTGTQTPKGMGIILLNRELPRQLAIDGLNQLADGVMQVLESMRNLFFWFALGIVRSKMRFFSHNSCAFSR